jgi:hypothetical protein
MKKGSKHSAETIQLISAKSGQAWADPELRARAAQRTTETYRDGTRPPTSEVWTPEVRARQSALMKKIYADRPKLRAQIEVSEAHREGGMPPAASGYSWSAEARMRASQRMRGKRRPSKTRAALARERELKVAERRLKAQCFDAGP